MVNYACALGQSETEKYFEWIITLINTDWSISWWMDRLIFIDWLVDYLKWWTFSSMEAKMFQILAVDKYPPPPNQSNFIKLNLNFLRDLPFYFAASGLPPRIQLSLAIPSTSTVGARNFLLLKTFAQKLVQEFSVSPSGTRVAMVTYSSTPRLVFRWNQYMNMKCTLNAISSLR